MGERTMMVVRRGRLELRSERFCVWSTSSLRRFTGDSNGVVAILAAILAPLLFILTGAGIDYARFVSEKTKLQAVTDAASLAAAKELGLTGYKSDNPDIVMQAVVEGYFASNLPQSRGETYQVEAHVVDKADSALRVEVTANASVPGFFGARLGLGDTEIQAGAVATVIGKPNICLLALDASAAGAIELNHDARVVGQDCSIFSNSTHSIGIKSKNDAQLSAQSICSAGGVQGGGRNFSPAALTDCPQFEDPLASRPEPDAGPCKMTGLEVKNETITLSPGTYCEGLKITGNSRVAFEPGLYVIKDGPMIVKDSAKIVGENTGFFFSGKDAAFRFDTETTIDLTAPMTGPLAGLLFFGSRQQTSTNYLINSDHAHQLLGTIYLPGGVLSIDANQPIADRSAYTAIVAKKVMAFSGPTVTLNTNYEKTDVPVPDGIRGIGVPTALVR